MERVHGVGGGVNFAFAGALLACGGGIVSEKSGIRLAHGGPGYCHGGAAAPLI